MIQLSTDQLRELVCNKGQTNGHPASPVAVRRQIIIGERGWVFVGDVRREEGDYILDNASCIRVWGTTNGLGELATKGKLSGTKLDPCGTVRIPELAVIGRIDVAAGVAL